MTSPSNTAWAREEALALAYKYAVGHLVDEAARKIESTLLAVERKAKEECARIADKEAEEYIAGSAPETWSFKKSQRAAFEMRSMGEAIKLVAAAIRSTLPPTSKATRG